MIIKKMSKYVICYRNDIQKKASGKIERMEAEFTGVRSLAKFLNAFKVNNPTYFVLVVLLVENNEGKKTFKPVKFLTPEYRAQKWLTGHKERLLANAVEQGLEVHWNHGLKERG